MLSGVTGFGFALIAVPPMLLFYEPERVVAATILLALATGWLLLIGISEHVQGRLVLGLLPGAVVGSFVGTILLARLNSDVIQVIAGAAVVLFGLAHLSGWAPSGTHGPAAIAVAGFASGALSTTVGMAGPPVVMLLTARRASMHAFRATTIAYFIGVSAVGATLLITGGLVGRDDVIFALALLPPTLLGLVSSRWLVRRVSASHFRLLTLGLLLATGLLGMMQALLALIR